MHCGGLEEVQLIHECVYKIFLMKAAVDHIPNSLGFFRQY